MDPALALPALDPIGPSGPAAERTYPAARIPS